MSGASAALSFDTEHVADMGRCVGQFVRHYDQSRRVVFKHDSPNDSLNNFANDQQISSPSQRPNNGEDGADMLPPSNGRNSRALTENREQTRDTLTERFKVHVTEPSKIAARKIGKSAETVDAYRQIGVPQSWADMVECCRKYPAFALDVVEAMGLDIDRDRESYVLFLSLQRQMQGRGK